MPVLEIEQDDVLDDAEVEGLVSGTSAGTSRSNSSKSFTASSRWIVVVLILVTGLLFVIKSDSTAISTDEKNLSDIEKVDREKAVPVDEKKPLETEVKETEVKETDPTKETSTGETDGAQKSVEEPQVETSADNPSENDGSGSEGGTPSKSLDGADRESWQYNKRGPPLTEEEENELAQKWGKWNFVDPKADTRPTEDFMAAYPNRDIPRSDFPANAWQVDTDYLRDFLKEATDLVERAMETILSEYGKGKFDSDESFEERAAAFGLKFQDKENKWVMGKDGGKKGGWTTTRSFDGLVRRVLHAIMTEDTFTLVMGGHSAAAGHGNHFQQSYTLQFQRVMEPVFARLGVKHVSRNMGMGGLGTIQNALGAGSLYGPDMDILMWDSGMTEKNAAQLDIFARQGLIGGDRVPVLWNGNNNVLKMLHDEADADVFFIGSGRDILPWAETLEELEKIPWAARYMGCGNEVKELCKPNRYNGTCWIERPDVVPTTKQKAEPGGRASWHPGNREHQLNGRVMAFQVLKALQKGLTMWSEADGFALPDDAWHMTQYNENIRSKVRSLDPSLGYCYDTESSKLPASACKYPIKAVSENTPRYNPTETSIRSIVVPPGKTSEPGGLLYEPPDVHNPILDAPKGEIEYLSIIENGVAFHRRLRSSLPSAESDALKSIADERHVRKLGDDITPGLGWQYHGKSGPDRCDGSYDSWCGKGPEIECLLYSHNDGRNGFFFDSYSGWLKMNLKGLKYGLIMIKFESWHASNANDLTKGWTSENNAESRRLGGTLKRRDNFSNETIVASSDGLQQDDWVLGAPDSRFLKSKPPPPCEEMEFHFAVDGKITKWNKNETIGRRQVVQRVVEVLVLMDDPDFTGGKEMDVELAIRLYGCARINTWLLSHVYWA